MTISNIDEFTQRQLQLLARYKPAARRILDYLVEQADKDGWTMVTQQNMADTLMYALITVQQNITLLKQHHFIAVQRHAQWNVYRINAKLLGLSAHPQRFSDPIVYSPTKKKRRKHGKKNIKN